ncbi:serine/threonine-protein kinase [Nannocystis sp. SCPEA4]|uniref:serine/threonine protein kinase n=1 Tax=Nannocystis sp. SCPEA4 TaxID=2996787 RepID=UPI002271E0A7|nr:serine/threonine-protein kinase [Nannocystis sp. SCPEA4]MCY1056530.1 protein kinase [Nannocystis sp. SCPEA4]
MTEPDLSGRIIKGRYLLHGPIGAGGMATVYEATDKELHKRVAVKVLKEQWRSNTSMVMRFHHEPRVTAQVQNEHLADVSDRGKTDDGIPFFVMEFLEGRSLSQEILDQAGPMPWRRVVELSLQICSALAAMHERGLVHRDVKPGNVFLLRRGGQTGDFVKVLDLGIAKAVEGSRDPQAHPQTGTAESAPFTPEYASPEQARGEKVDARSDLYSLGVVMYQLLTGRRPFVLGEDDDPWHLLEKHSKQPPPAMEDIAPDVDIPDQLERVVLRCLEKKAAARWASAEQLAEALRAVEAAEREAREHDAGTKTAPYYPPEPPRALPRALHRALMLAHGFMLFSLSCMTMAMIDLPGVRVLGELLRPAEAKPRSPAPAVVLEVEDEPDAPRPVERPAAKTPEVAPVPPPEPALPDSPKSEAPLPTAPKPEPAPSVDAAEEAASDSPPKTVVRGESPRLKVGESTAKPRPPKKPPSDPNASAQQLVQKFLRKHKGQFAECGEKLAFEKGFSVQIWVDAKGRITGTGVVTDANSIPGKCIQTALQGLVGRSIAGIKAAGSHTAIVRLPL